VESGQASAQEVEYFAYGSNMRPDALSQLCPTAELIGPARLPDHRLKFMRQSKRWQSGAADVVSAPGFTTWGALFRLDREELRRLDKQEGAGRAYELCEKTVFAQDGTRHSARLYTVVEAAPSEVCPSREYIRAMLAGAQAAEVPERYVTFLSYLEEEARRAESEGFRAGLVVRPTATRREARGIGLARIHPDDAEDLSGPVAVVLHERAVVAELCTDADCSPGQIELDQGLRHALGMPGRESYGFDVALAKLSGRPPASRLVRPRMLAAAHLAPVVARQREADRGSAPKHDPAARAGRGRLGSDHHMHAGRWERLHAPITDPAGLPRLCGGGASKRRDASLSRPGRALPRPRRTAGVGRGR
jgi:gamma-glutamylcyclotransferase (GGCT)/AIG2-like uncharacterized protein YtfP